MPLWLLMLPLLGWGLLRIFQGYPPPGASTRVLARREMALLASVADAMYPAGGDVPPSGTEAEVPAYTDRYVAAVPPRVRLLMRLLFFLIEHATLFFPAPGWSGMRRFSSLSAAQQVAVLEGWRSSRFFPRRLVFTSLRAVVTMGYFAHPAVLRQLRLAPYAMETPVCEADLLYPPVGRHPDSIPWTEADLTPPGPAAPLDVNGPLHPDYAGSGGGGRAESPR